jgi:hypothetical protein
MRSRTRSQDAPAQEREREQKRQPERSAQRDEERTQARGVRVPKIQYRFMKELEERRLAPNEVQGAYDMADKIRRYPLEPTHVMASWEKFTGGAIKDYKARTGKDEDRDQQHRTYAVMFAAVRDTQSVKDVIELKARIREVARNNDGRDDRSITEKLPPRPEPAQQAAQEKEKEKERERAPTQRTLALPEQTFGPERTTLDDRVDKMVGRLKEIPSELRSPIELTAREMLHQGHHTARSAREALLPALEELRQAKTPENTVRALTLATIARVPEHSALLAELRTKKLEEQREITATARERLERYSPLGHGLSLLQGDQIGAAVHDVLNPSAETRREALVLARARELEEVKSFSWERFAGEMVSEPG